MSICGPGQLGRYSDSLRAGRSEDRIPTSATFSTFVHTGPGPNQPPLKWVPDIFNGIKRPGRGFDNPPPFSAEVKEVLHGLL